MDQHLIDKFTDDYEYDLRKIKFIDDYEKTLVEKKKMIDPKYVFDKKPKNCKKGNCYRKPTPDEE